MRKVDFVSREIGSVWRPIAAHAHGAIVNDIDIALFLAGGNPSKPNQGASAAEYSDTVVTRATCRASSGCASGRRRGKPRLLSSREASHVFASWIQRMLLSDGIIGPVLQRLSSPDWISEWQHGLLPKRVRSLLKTFSAGCSQNGERSVNPPSGQQDLDLDMISSAGAAPLSGHRLRLYNPRKA